MTALWIATKLNFINCQKINLPIKGHCLNGADEIFRMPWNNSFLAGYQSDLRGPLNSNDSLVILTGEKSQRESDHAGIITKHALKGEMGLPGIRRP